MNKIIIPAILYGMLISLPSFAQDTATANSTLKSATVYYGFGAELTHRSSVRVSPSIRQIVISGLATTADANSVQVSIPESVALLSQKFRIYTPEQPEITDPRLKKLNDSIRLLQKGIGSINNQLDIESSTMEKTSQLIELVINKSDNKTITSDEALKLITACTGKMEKAKSNIYRLNNERADLNEKISLLQTRIYEISKVRPEQKKPVGQLILQVKCSNAGEVPVELSYFTNNAGFTPMYDVRVNTKNNDIKIVYKAGIYQSTGIDWNQTKLTLSTANPNWSGTTPILNPWYLQVFEPQIRKLELAAGRSNMASNTIPGAYKDEAMKMVIVSTDNEDGYTAQAGNLNVNPSNLGSYTKLNENQLNTTFEIELPYDIKTDGELQSVTIKEEKINATLKNYAVPKLNRDAFLLAEIADWESLNLLPGVANIIMDDTYLGRTNIDPNISADTMNLSLGKDRRVVINRVKVKEFTTTKKSGSYTTQTFTYEITVKNNKSSDVDLILKDQYPLSQVKEVEVKLLASDSAAINEELGVLTWNIQLKSGESKKFRISYSVKYPSEKKIANL